MDLSIYSLRTKDILTLCVLSLLCLGVLMVQSASSDVTNQTGWEWTAKGIKHATFATSALATFLAVGWFDCAWVLRPAKKIWHSPIFWMLAIAGLANLAVLIPGVGVEVNHSRRWLPLGPIQVQPSELGKWAIVLYLAYFLANRPLDVNRFFRGFIPMLIPVAAICLLVVIQDFGTALLIALCALVIMIAGKVRWTHLLIVLPPIIAAGLWFVMHKAYRWQRITAFANPYAAPTREGYHMIQSLLSFATGGVTGRGLGNGIQKLGYLPEDTTDFIFSVICEELGLFGALMTIALYVGILYCAWEAMKQRPDSGGKLMAFGIGMMVCLQATINIAVSTVSVPTKGLPLPLISAGGSGLIITCAALGLLRSACNEKATVNPAMEQRPPDLSGVFLPPPAGECKSA